MADVIPKENIGICCFKILLFFFQHVLWKRMKLGTCVYLGLLNLRLLMLWLHMHVAFSIPTARPVLSVWLRLLLRWRQVLSESVWPTYPARPASVQMTGGRQLHGEHVGTASLCPSWQCCLCSGRWSCSLSTTFEWLSGLSILPFEHSSI